MSWKTVLKNESLQGADKEAYELLLEYGELQVYPSLYGRFNKNLTPVHTFYKDLVRYEPNFFNLSTKGLIDFEYHYDPYASDYDRATLENPYMDVDDKAFTVRLKNESQREAAKRKHANNKYLTEEYRKRMAREISQGQRKRGKDKRRKTFEGRN